MLAHDESLHRLEIKGWPNSIEVSPMGKSNRLIHSWGHGGCSGKSADQENPIGRSRKRKPRFEAQFCIQQNAFGFISKDPIDST